MAADPAAIEALFIDLFLDAHARTPKQITLDLDATDDPLHGHQEGRIFHGYGACPRAGEAGPGGLLLLFAASAWRAMAAWSARSRRRWWRPAPRPRRPARRFRDFTWTTLDSWRPARRVVAKAEWTQGEANPRFVVTSLAPGEAAARHLYEAIDCARGEMENRVKECHLDLFADRTSAATMRANQVRLWFASAAYVLLCARRRIGLAHTEFATATCMTLRLKLLKIGALVRVSVRRVHIAMASACPTQHAFALAHARLR